MKVDLSISSRSIRIVAIILFSIPVCKQTQSQGTWTSIEDFPGNPGGAAVGFSINDKGYLATGTGVSEGYSKRLWSYDPATDTWSQLADLPGEGRISAIGFSIANKGYVGTGQNEKLMPLSDFWEYDPVMNSWTQKSDFGGGKRESAFGFALNGKGYIGTGYKSQMWKDFWEFDPDLDSWTKKADYGGGQIAGATAFVIGSAAYVGTGKDESGDFRRDLWEYDPTIDGWTAKPDLPGNIRGLAAGFSIDNYGYIGLGYAFDTTQKYLGDFWRYGPESDTWNQEASYPGDPGANAVAFVVEGKGYVGMAASVSSSGNDFWQFTPGCTVPDSFSINVVSSDLVTLQWNAVTGAQKYQVRYKVKGNNPWTVVTAKTNSKKISGLSAGSTYVCEVRSVCTTQPVVASAWSEKESFNTPLRLSAEEETASLKVYPNPLSSSAIVSFALEKNSVISIELRDAAGRKIKIIAEAMFEPGEHSFIIDREQLSAGIYLLRIVVDGQTSITKIAVE